jgi:peptide/nickel transport system substrate-binding protein
VGRLSTGRLARARVLGVGVKAALAGLLAAGCGGAVPGAAGSAGAGRTIVVATGSEPDTLNPILGYGTDGAALVFDGLVARDAANALQPALADALPSVSADGLTVTAHLRPGVRFHTGGTLGADDVVFTYRSVLDPKVDSTLRSDLDMIASVEAPDPSTVTFTLKYPYAPFLQRLTLGIVEREALEGQDINQAPFNKAPVGTGPYIFESWTPGDRITLKANADYWGGKPANDRLVVALVEDDNVRAQRARAGEFDAVELPPRLANSLAGHDGLRVEAVRSADYRGVMLPMGNPVTGDLAVRRALDLAVDRAALVSGILAGGGEPAFGPVAPTATYHEPSVVSSPAPDLARAKALLDDAGWVAGGDGVRAKNGTPARFTLMYPASDSLRKDLSLAVAANARATGIEVTPEGLTWDAIEPRMKADALLMGWGNAFDPDFINYRLYGSRFAGQDYWNPGNYNSPVVDQALEDGRTKRDDAERKAAYSAFQKQLATDLPWVHLVFLKHTYVLKPTVTGVQSRTESHEHGVDNSIWWNVHTWTNP